MRALIAVLYLHAIVVHLVMPERGLKLALEVGQSLPIHLCWRVNDGYLRVIGHTAIADIFTLGIWGPGEIVMPYLLNQQAIELRALSSASVHEWSPDLNDRESCSLLQINQMATLLQLTRSRPVEARLFNLLIWLGHRFGVKTEQGLTLPLEGMNLTHRQLAEMASVSRVTVTKALGHFRHQAWLVNIGNAELLTTTGINTFAKGE